MKVAIMSQNLQGLNDESFTKIVSNYYQIHVKNLEILCFQEHKLRGDKLAVLGSRIWKGATFMAKEAEAAYNNVPDGPEAGRGGVCLWVSPQVQHLISTIGKSRSRRAQWMRLVGIAGGDIAILNVYAPNSTAARCELWEELIETLPKDCRWLCAGDWNFVERRQDKSRNNNYIMTAEERRLFELLKSTFDIHDPFPASNMVRYSWDNRR
jgi:exonuclease III